MSCLVRKDPKLTTRILGKEDDVQRRDALHAIINSLPDPNYATLRALILVSLFLKGLISGCGNGSPAYLIQSKHLNRVQERSLENRMNAGNIAICLG